MPATSPAASRLAAVLPTRVSAPAHSWQGLLGFSFGGLLATILMTGPAVLSTEPHWEWIGRAVGFSLGGAIGGAALAFGFDRGGGWRGGALGFGLGFLIPAALAAPTAAEMPALRAGPSAVGTLLAGFIAFATAFGLGGAVGMSFLAPKLFWDCGWRFFLGGGIGGLIAAGGAAQAAGNDSRAQTALVGVAFVLAGQLVAFALGGFLAGRALERHQPWESTGG